MKIKNMELIRNMLREEIEYGNQIRRNLNSSLTPALDNIMHGYDKRPERLKRWFNETLEKLQKIEGFSNEDFCWKPDSTIDNYVDDLYALAKKLLQKSLSSPTINSQKIGSSISNQNQSTKIFQKNNTLQLSWDGEYLKDKKNPQQKSMQVRSGFVKQIFSICFKDVQKAKRKISRMELNMEPLPIKDGIDRLAKNWSKRFSVKKEVIKKMISYDLSEGMIIISEDIQYEIGGYNQL